MLRTFVDNFSKSDQSIISNLFYSCTCTTDQCCTCGETSYNYQTQFYLSFHLEEVRKFKIYNGLNNNNFNKLNLNSNTVDIYDCCRYDNRTVPITGANNLYCNYSKKLSDSITRKNLVSGPNILIILFNRGKGDVFKVKLNFYEKLNLYNYIELKETGTQYELFRVIIHLGESGSTGHYITYCLNKENNKWYNFNDSKVNICKEEDIYKGSPYLLLYEMI